MLQIRCIQNRKPIYIFQVRSFDQDTPNNQKFDQSLLLKFFLEITFDIDIPLGIFAGKESLFYCSTTITIHNL